MIAGFDAMAPILPVVSKRGVEIRHWTPEPLTLLRARMHGNHLREGHVYAQLFINGQLWMSDTRDEMVANAPVADAKGRVLIVGLGLGMALRRVLKNKGVMHVDVIEKNKTVSELVWPHVGKRDTRAHLITADAYTWAPTTYVKYDFIWLDVWLNYPEPDEIRTIRKLYRRWLKRGGFMGQWEGND